MNATLEREANHETSTNPISTEKKLRRVTYLGNPNKPEYVVGHEFSVKSLTSTSRKRANRIGIMPAGEPMRPRVNTGMSSRWRFRRWW